MGGRSPIYVYERKKVNAEPLIACLLYTRLSYPVNITIM
uniref:Uncharacterized protein n=1 Tax=Siphoviridae sp. ctGa111 TaxID=2825413 RepID=A0A8S5VDG4_9CAUD|nr:MAG TPA: hypothetical protein [Siphoviridae sp. ctGa111]